MGSNRVIQVARETVEKDFAAIVSGLRTYTERFWDVLHPESAFTGGYVMDCICDHYEEWMDPAGSIQNLIVNQPFRTGKSTLLVYAMTYRWFTRPSTRWMFATYDYKLSIRDSIRCRNLILHPRFQAVLRASGRELFLKPDQNTQQQFTNNHEGFRMALTVGKGLGEGADYLLVDDPIDPRRARSRQMREACIEWWRETYRHRVTDPKKTRRLVVQQRINQADLTGYLLENEQGEWQHLVLPMRYEPRRILFTPIGDAAPPPAAPANAANAAARTEDEEITYALTSGLSRQTVSDPIHPTSLQLRVKRHRDAPEGSGRARHGDLLWPERFPEKQVREFERTLMGAAAGQLQQRPSSATGNVFRVERAGAAAGRFNDLGQLAAVHLLSHDGVALVVPAARWRWFQVMDTASTARDESSYTVVGTFGLSDVGHLLLWHIFREKLEVPDQEPAIREMMRGPCRWDDENRLTARTGEPWPGRLVARYIEPKSSGLGLLQSSLIHGYMLTALKVAGDKTERAGHAAALYQNGMVYHRPGPWLSTAVEELRLFPNADYDDIADVVAYAGHVAMTDKLVRAHVHRRVVLNSTAEERQLENKKLVPEHELDELLISPE